MVELVAQAGEFLGVAQIRRVDHLVEHRRVGHVGQTVRVVVPHIGRAPGFAGHVRILVTRPRHQVAVGRLRLRLAVLVRLRRHLAAFTRALLPLRLIVLAVLIGLVPVVGVVLWTVFLDRVIRQAEGRDDLAHRLDEGGLIIDLLHQAAERIADFGLQPRPPQIHHVPARGRR